MESERTLTFCLNFDDPSQFWKRESTLSRIHYIPERVRRMGVDGKPLYYNHRITSKPVTDEHLRAVGGNPFPNFTDLNVALSEKIAYEVARYGSSRQNRDLCSWGLKAIENPRLRNLIIGFDHFKKPYEFLIKKALYTGVNVKLVDFSNHEVKVFEALAKDCTRNYKAVTLPDGSIAYEPAPLCTVTQRLQRLPREKMTFLENKTMAFEWVKEFKSPTLQWDTLVGDRDAGRTESKLRPELQAIADWRRENHKEHCTRWAAQTELDRLQRCTVITIENDPTDTDPASKKTYKESYRKALKETEELLALPKTQKNWTHIIRYCLYQEQTPFIEWGITKGWSRLNREHLPLLQCAYECDTAHPLDRVEEAELWISLVWYVAHDEKPTCYNHKSLSAKKWALMGNEISKDDEQPDNGDIADTEEEEDEDDEEDDDE